MPLIQLTLNRRIYSQRYRPNHFPPIYGDTHNIHIRAFPAHNQQLFYSTLIAVNGSASSLLGDIAQTRKTTRVSRFETRASRRRPMAKHLLCWSIRVIDQRTSHADQIDPFSRATHISECAVTRVLLTCVCICECAWTDDWPRRKALHSTYRPYIYVDASGALLMVCNKVATPHRVSSTMRCIYAYGHRLGDINQNGPSQAAEEDRVHIVVVVC